MHQPTGAKLYWAQDFSPHPKPTPTPQSSESPTSPSYPSLSLGCLLWESIALFTRISGSPSEHGRIPFPCPLEVRCEQVPCLGNDMWPSLVSMIDLTFVLVSFSQCQRRASISPVSRWSQRQSILPLCVLFEATETLELLPVCNTAYPDTGPFHLPFPSRCPHFLPIPTQAIRRYFLSLI